MSGLARLTGSVSRLWKDTTDRLKTASRER
jgi:hypothetical protein